MDAHYGHSGSKEVQISGFQLISQEYLDFIQRLRLEKAKSTKSLITDLTDASIFLYVG